ncbi:MAG: COR domain-containing protein, partial [Cyclobacteriaceae bacterium]
KEPQTDGINIEDIEFEDCETFQQYEKLHGITGHFWDFGGQEIMNATHQFFLTNRSVYVLLLDARKDTHVSAQVRQWVKRIKATGGNSPIVVVANQIDVNPGFGFENERELQEEFPEIKAFIKASCADGTRIETIKEKLSELIPQAELFDTEIDERWIQIKDKLQEEIDSQTDKYLDEKRFNEICQEFELIESRQRQNAIQFLHDLGILLHFKEIDTYKYFVLDPYWITYGVYQILTSDKAGKLNGLVPMNELDYIINEEEDKKESYRTVSHEKIKYLSNDRRFLVDVLHQFKLSFYQPDRQKFIIPDLLDTVEPIDVTNPIRKAAGSIHFVYEYEYLLKSIMPRIMVEKHELIKERWRTGCVLQKGHCKAVITSYQQRITISVAGDHPEKREFMSILRHQLDTINSKLTEPPKMLIPLPGAKGFASYKTLLILQKKGRREFEIFEPDYQEFKISTLLEGIDDVDKLDRLHELIEKNHSEAKHDREQMLGNQIIIENKADEILEDTQTIKKKLNENYQYLISQPGNEELQKHLISEVNKLTEQQTDEIAASLITMLQHHFEHSEEMLDEKLQDIYENLTQTEDTQLKLKLGIPLGNLIGLNIEGEFDIKNWSKRMYDKYSWDVFKMIGGFKSE